MSAETVPLFNAPGLAPTDASRLEAAGLSPHRMIGASTRREGARNATGRLPWPATSLGQTPTLPPAPTSPMAPQPGPVVPATPQIPMVPRAADQRPVPASGRVPRTQVSRFLRLADESLVVVRGTAIKASSPIPGRRDRAATLSIGRCMSDLAKSVTPLGQAIKELRAAEAGGRDADLSLEQVSALEAFSKCAVEAADARARQRGADAAGGGVPVVLALALALL